jgi:hypothetical protein
VVVTVLAAIFLGEKAEGREWAGMLICSAGTFLCLHFGPRPDEEHIKDHTKHSEDGELAIGSQATLYAYAGIVFVVLVVLLVMEHAHCLGLKMSVTCHYFTLPVATGLAFGLEKVFNTEIGLLMHGHSAEENLARPEIWIMASMIVVLGVLDLYLNLRGAKVLPVQAFIPMTFAFATSLQFFQSMFIFGEFVRVSPADRALSVLGALMALVGTLIIQPPRFAALCPTGGDEELLKESEMPEDDSVATGDLGVAGSVGL